MDGNGLHGNLTATQPSFMNIEQIKNRTLTVGVIGLGYAGLPVAVGYAQRGIHAIGVDINADHVALLNSGRTHTPDIPDSQVTPLVGAGLFRASTDYRDLSDADAVFICVPTPLSESSDPDNSYIIKAVESLVPHLKAGAAVILQSTTHPGATEELVLPRIAAQGGTVGTDFYVAFSPERVEPGNTKFGTENTPRVVGGITPACGELVGSLLQIITDEVVVVSDAKTAEMSKLMENTFRAVNIAYINEIALMCDKLGIDVWEVIRASASKPFGFMPFYPGPGIGGHCIPVDPEYLAWKMRTVGYETRFIRLAHAINTEMADHTVNLVIRALNRHRKALNGARVLALGVTYKPDVADIRESPSDPVIRKLLAMGADLVYHDPLAPTYKLHDGRVLTGLETLDTAALENADVVVILTAHRAYNYETIVRHAPLLVDTRNATGAFAATFPDKIVRL
jgi:UDP-N-acetyl-D-glucosamine dehydrogenase